MAFVKIIGHSIRGFSLKDFYFRVSLCFHRFLLLNDLSNPFLKKMTKKDDDNPLEEIQKQLRDLMNNKNVQVAFAPFMESMKANSEGEKEEKDSDKPTPPPKIFP